MIKWPITRNQHTICDKDKFNIITPTGLNLIKFFVELYVFMYDLILCAPKLEKGKKKCHHVEELGDVRLDKQKKWLQSRAGLPLPPSSPTTN